jgi:hypothetical protein
MRSTVALTAEKFSEVYTDQAFRHAVAHAHQYCDKGGEALGWQTCTYPVTYAVTEPQIADAKAELARAKEQALSTLGNKLVFVGMGCDYAERYPGDVCNHRIRTSFINAAGKTYFIEVGTGRGLNIRVDFSVDRDMQNEFESKLTEICVARNAYTRNSPEWSAHDKAAEQYRGQGYYNFAKLQTQTPELLYTKQNVLDIVNKYFECSFSEMEVDEYTLNPDDFICKSPK